MAAETGFVLSRDPDTVRAPDAAFVSKARFEAIGDTEKFWPGATHTSLEEAELLDAAPAPSGSVQ